VLNCVKKLADIPDNIHLIVPAVLEPMLMLKEKILHDKNPLLCLDDVACPPKAGTAESNMAHNVRTKQNRFITTPPIFSTFTIAVFIVFTVFIDFIPPLPA